MANYPRSLDLHEILPVQTVSITPTIATTVTATVPPVPPTTISLNLPRHEPTTWASERVPWRTAFLGAIAVSSAAVLFAAAASVWLRRFRANVSGGQPGEGHELRHGLRHELEREMLVWCQTVVRTVTGGGPADHLEAFCKARLSGKRGGGTLPGTVASGQVTRKKQAAGEENLEKKIGGKEDKTNGMKGEVPGKQARDIRGSIRTRPLAKIGLPAPPPSFPPPLRSNPNGVECMDTSESEDEFEVTEEQVKLMTQHLQPKGTM